MIDFKNAKKIEQLNQQKVGELRGMKVKIEEEKKVGQNTHIHTYKNTKKEMEIGQDEESDSDAEEGRRWNPYTEFLENIEDEGSEEEVILENILKSFTY